MSRPPSDAGSFEAHLSIEDLSVMAEGHAAPPDAVVHLSKCRSCMAAYADAVRYRVAWLAHPEDFRGSYASPRVPGNDRLLSRRSPFEIGAWVGAAALVAIGVAIVALPPWRHPGNEPKLPSPIRHLLAYASSEGLVFPGGEAGAAGEGPSYRARPAATEEASAALEALRQRIEAGDRSLDRLYALAAGLIATDRIDLADDYLGEARDRTPQDHRFVVLAAIVASRRGEMAEAETLLLRARRLAPRDPTVALDLGLVAIQTRGIKAARPYLFEASRQDSGSPVARRAARFLQGEPSR
jgi:tetratricopeptide (TPR) repeat protein